MNDGVIRQVYMLGLGALGSIYAAKLYDMDPASVKIIADDKRANAFARSGIMINGKPYRFEFVSPENKHQPADLIIIAVKYMHLQQAVDDIKSFVGKDTIVISLLNGISSEEIIGNMIGAEHMLFAYGVGMDAVRQGTQTNFTNAGRVVFGEKRNDIFSGKVKAVKDLFDRANIPSQIPADMERALWSKFMMNIGINQASAVLKAPYGIFQKEGDAQKLMLMAAAEVLAISECCGIYLNHADIDGFIKILNGLDPIGKTSMLQDIEAGRKTEVDIFAGTMMELGKKYNVETPVNETLFRIIKVMERNF